MRPNLVTAGLILFLLLACVGLGLTIGSYSAANPSGGGGAAATAATATNSHTLPEVVVTAKEVSDIITSSGAASLQNGTVVILGTPTASPIPGLHVIITPEGQNLIFHARTFSYTVITNDTGVGSLYLPQGNYSATAAVGSYNFTTTVKMRTDFTALLNLTIVPGLNSVTDLKVTNTDSGLGLQPSSTIYAEVTGPFHYSQTTVYEISGLSGATGGTQVVLGVQVVGFYPAPSGTWVLMQPQTTGSPLPTSNVALSQLTANSTVTYRAD